MNNDIVEDINMTIGSDTEDINFDFDKDMEITSYNDLSDKPKINSVTLIGNKTSNDLGLQPAGNYLEQESDPVFTASASYGITSEDITNWDNKSNFSGSYNDLTDKPEIPDVSNFITKNVDNLTYYTKTSDLSAVATSGSYTDLLNKPTIPDVSSFITKDVNNLTYYTLKTSTGSYIDLSINTTTYVVTLDLKDIDGNVISTDNFDLPLESVVVNGYYDNNTKKVVLTLENGSTVDFSVADLVAGLQTEITSTNKLSSDYVDDTNSGNKFVTTSEKNTWNNKSDFSGNYNDLTNKPTIPDVSNFITKDVSNLTYYTLSTNLANVATSGSYNDLSNKPTIPSKLSDLTNDNNTVTDASYVHTDNNYTTTEKNKLSGLENYDDTEINKKIDRNETLYNALPETTGTGTSLTINNTAECGIKLELQPSELSQDDTPTSSNPQNIHVITGNNEIKLKSKNWFDKNNPNILNAFFNAGVITSSSSGSKCVYIPCEADTTYTMSKVASARFQVAYSNTLPAINGSILGTIVDHTGTEITITTGSSAKYLVAFVYTNTDTKTFDEILDSIQIELGSSATTHTIYQEKTLAVTLGDLEYCKIGDYKDEFYKATAGDTSLQNGKWYLKKNIIKIDSYNGETITTSYISTTGGLDTGATIYYGTTTPTYILLNNTLQEQLDNICEWAKAYDGQTNIRQTNAYLPFVIKYRAVIGITETDISNWNGKQNALVSGTNIKTINNESLLGSGNINISGSGGSSTDVQINGTSITSSGTANIITKGTYNSSTNKIATESDLPNITGKQNITDNTLTTTNKTVPTAINEVNSIALGANQALSYSNYSAMVTAFNALDDDVYRVGQNVMIVTLEVPDLWISGIESTSSTYTYVDDATITTALSTTGYIQVGYYKLSALETQKVDLTNYVQTSDLLNAIYPVGSIYISTNSTSPQTLFGGTWAEFGQGRTLIGVGNNISDGTTTKSFVAGSEEGKFGFEISHSHGLESGYAKIYLNPNDKRFLNTVKSNVSYSRNRRMDIPNATANSDTSVVTTGTELGGTTDSSTIAQSLLQPYVVVYMWQRTA